MCNLNHAEQIQIMQTARLVFECMSGSKPVSAFHKNWSWGHPQRPHQEPRAEPDIVFLNF